MVSTAPRPPVRDARLLEMVGGAPRTWLNDVRSLGGFGWAWVAGNIAFSAVRALIAWPTFGRYGVNPWVFLALDILTAPPYGLSQALTVKILREQDRPQSDAFLWAAGVVVFFLAPYVYIFAVSGNVPVLAYVGVVAWMLLFGVLAVLRMYRQIKADPNRT
ncbi:hypothetical protein BH10ACT3_BH10ACT3_09330 [soil metagenome]